MEHVLADNRKGAHKNIRANPDRKPMYEFILYIGNRDSHCPDDIADKLMNMYVLKIMPKKFPNFRITHINMHNDEFSFDRKGNRVESPLHYHVSGVFIAHALTKEESKQEKEFRERSKREKRAEIETTGNKWDEDLWKAKDWRRGLIKRYGKALERGPELQTSMTGACNEMHFFTEAKKGTAQQQFEECVRYDFMDFCEQMGLSINRTKGVNHSHDDKDIYQMRMDNEELEKSLKLQEERLNIEKDLLQSRMDDLDYWIEHQEEIQAKNESDKNSLILKKQQLEKQESEINSREYKLNRREYDLNQKEKDLNKKSEDSRNYYIEGKKEHEQASSLYLKNEQICIKTNSDNFEAIKKIESWNEAANEIETSNQWVLREFVDYQNKKDKPNAIKDLYERIVKGVKSVVIKVKQAYDSKIKRFNDYFYGTREFFNKSDGVVCEYSYGLLDYSRMLKESSITEFENAIEECKKRGKSSFGEMEDESGLAFYERHFTRAKEVRKEIDYEIEIKNEKNQEISW